MFTSLKSPEREKFASPIPVTAVFDKVIAYSMLSGGLIAIVPQAWFARQAFHSSGARSARVVAHRSYAAEVGKFLLSAAGFGVVFALVRPIDGPAVFIGYLVMLAIQIFGSWLLLRRGPAD